MVDMLSRISLRQSSGLGARASAIALIAVACSTAASAQAQSTEAPPTEGALAEAPPPEPHPHTVYPWIVVAAGSAALVTGVALYVSGHVTYPDACAIDVKQAEGQLPNGLANHSRCPPGTSYDRNDKAYSATQTWDLGLSLTVVGAVLAVAGLSWHFLEASPTRVSVSFRHGAGVAVDSRF
jgi:hypothetical protein